MSKPERQDIMTRAAAWMQARGWRQKLAKRRDGVYPERSRGEQTLFDHTLIELDVLLKLMPILASPFRYRFTPDTQKRRREALKRVREEFDNDLDAASAACNY